MRVRHLVALLLGAAAVTSVSASASAVETVSQEEALSLTAEAETCQVPDDQWKGFLWVCFICYMFYAQEHVCEEYFVAAIDVCVAEFKKKGSPWGEESVAGATICALGCNGPELFTNLIACCILGGSDVGVGTIVGSEIFNLLVIIGGAAIAAPQIVTIDRVPFARDVFFYGLSIVLLAVTLKDGLVQTYEACTLFAFAGIYTGAVYYTSTLMKKANIPQQESTAPEPEMGRIHGFDVEVHEYMPSRMANSRDHQTQRISFDPTTAGMSIHEHLVDKHEDQGDDHKKTERGSIGFQFKSNKDDPLLGGKSIVPYKFLKEVTVKSKAIIDLDFHFNALEKMTLRMKLGDPEKREELLKAIAENSLGKAWTHDYDPTPKGAFLEMKHHISTAGGNPRIILSELICFPIEFLLTATLFFVDVKDIKRESRWMGCFSGAMVWLGIFSYLMCNAADAINYYFCVPTSVLGITLCAVGTSFPNAVASILMAKQNKSALAVANALGSNVQNIFLALAFPWVLVTIFPIIPYHGQPAQWWQPFPMAAPGLMSGVYWMLGTLVLALVFVVLPPFGQLTPAAGWLLVVAYVIYVLYSVNDVMHFVPVHMR